MLLLDGQTLYLIVPVRKISIWHNCAELCPKKGFREERKSHPWWLFANPAIGKG
jgi:hypothetical protein